MQTYQLLISTEVSVEFLMDGLYDDVLGSAGAAGDAASAATAHQVAAAEDRARVLEKNISCLFATARLEMMRKDQQITKLQEA